MIPGARLIIIGRQGSGKGTQCTGLSHHYIIPHVSTGDILRSAVRERTGLGLRAKEIMDAGGLVPDDIMIGIIEGRLVQADAVGRGYVLDGFPRTVAQATALDELTAQRPVDVVIDLDVPRELVLQRLSARRFCPDCSTNYVATGRERQPWTCDVCGGDVKARDDDRPDAINRRLDLYEEQTSPLIDYYLGKGMLATVKGVGQPEHVYLRLVDTIERWKRRRSGA